MKQYYALVFSYLIWEVISYLIGKNGFLVDKHDFSIINKKNHWDNLLKQYTKTSFSLSFTSIKNLKLIYDILVPLFKELLTQINFGIDTLKICTKLNTINFQEVIPGTKCKCCEHPIFPSPLHFFTLT